MEKGQTKFYNNRPVMLLREEADGTWFVSATLDLSHDITGSNFCTQCNVGGDYKGGHTCVDAGEIIEHVMENISDHEVFWVQPQYLRDEPFEKKPFDSLVAEIEKLKAEKKQLELDKKYLNDEINGRNADFESLSIQLADLREKIAFSQNELIKTDSEPIEIPKHIKIGVKEINSKTFLSLVEDALKFRDLDSGGVDNWEWYSESLKSEDYESDAINYLIQI